MTAFADLLISGLATHVAAGRTRVAVVGMTGDALEVAAAAAGFGADVALFAPDAGRRIHPRLRSWRELVTFAPAVVVIAADHGKEHLLRAAAGVLDGTTPLPHVVVAGLRHQEVRDALFEELDAPSLVPSYATGHPHTRAHLYDCLRAAAVHGRSGAIVELGAFKGGTAVWLAKAAKRLGLCESPVIAFDSWDGFPPRRSLLDLYEHPRCIFRDIEAVRRATEPFGIELVPGDIFDTAPARLAHERVLLAFVDTDNYSGARAALTTIASNLVPGGAIVLDHFVTTAEYVYTVGERIAAVEALQEGKLFHLHGTGVFVNVA